MRPACEFELRLNRLAALAHVLPVLARPVALNQALDTGGLAQFGQILLAYRFQLNHDRITAKGSVASHQLGALFWRECLEQTHQPKFLSYPVAGRSGCGKFDCISVG